MTELQLFDALSPAIEDALRASIRRFGVIVPVVRDQHGRIVDGHHRSRIAEELGVDFAVQVVSVADEDEAREIARTLNSDRRHLTEEQRRPVVVELRQQGHSYRAIGGALGVSHTQARADVEAARLEGAFQSEPERIVRLGGGSYPATRPAVVEPEPDAIDDVPLWDEPEPAPTVNTPAEPVRTPVEPAWSADETERRKHLEAGETVVISFRGNHANLYRWADANGYVERIDRRSDWGNPFEMPADGDRDTVIRNYAEHYLPHKPSLLNRMVGLRGKALACWCAPDPCHGDVLKARADQC